MTLDVPKINNGWWTLVRVVMVLLVLDIVASVIAFPLVKNQWIGFLPVIPAVGILIFGWCFRQRLKKMFEWLQSLSVARFLILILVAGMGLRVLLILLVPFRVTGDDAVYHHFAHQWLTQGEITINQGGKEYLVTHWVPGPSLQLAGFYLLFGESVRVGQLSQVFWSGMTLLAVYLFGMRLCGPRVGRTATFVYAFWPSMVFYPVCLGYEIMLGFVITLISWFALRQPPQDRSYGTFFVLGLMIGIGCYVKSVLAIMVILIAGAYVVQRYPLRKWLPRLCLTLAAQVLVLVPWTYRNYKAYGEFIPMTSNLGHALRESYRHNPFDEQGNFIPYQYDPSLTPPEDNRKALREALAYMREDWMKTLYHIGDHHARTWGTETTVVLKLIGERTEGGKIVKNFSYFLADLMRALFQTGWLLAVVAMTVATCFVCRGRKLDAGLVMTVIWHAYFCFGLTWIHPDPRMRLPIVPITAIWAAWGIVAWVDRKKKGEQDRRPLNDEKGD